MITQPTTLLLGAGASAHLGYPLGSGLRAEILQLITGLRSWTVRQTDSTSDDFYDFARSPDGENFVQIFKEGVYLSIDELLNEHRKFERIGKRLIAYCLQKYELWTSPRFVGAGNGEYSIP